MIKLGNISFRYPKAKKDTIKDISFEVGKGEILGLLGPSGAGKSTIQKLLIGILKGYQGSIKIGGHEISSIDNSFYERIGVGFELPNLHNKLTAFENLQIFQNFYHCEHADIDMLLDMLGLSEYKNVKVSQFSKGMKMRLNFCRSLINNPEILFLDEPTSGLDPANAKIMKDLILEKKRSGTTILITTHNMNVAEDICDCVAFIVDGKISLIESPRELKLRKGQKSIIVEYKENGVIDKKEFAIKRLGINSDFIELLNTKNIERIITNEATLEDIFIDVTGRSLK